MATVTGLTADRMLEIEAASVVDGDVVGDDLVLTRHDGSTLVAGNVRGPKGDAGVNMTAGARWGNTNAYVVNNTVGYGGRLYTCIQANSDKCPPFYNDYWTPVTGASTETWPLMDPNFMAEDLDAYELFWRSGTVTTALTQTAGEFETGFQAAKFVMAASSSQRIYERGEVLVRGGEVITVSVRAKITAAAAVAPVVSVGLFQADKNGSPQPFGAGAAEVGGAPLYGPLGTNWATFTFTVTAAVGKPRSRMNVLFQQAAGNGSTIVVDRIEISRVQTKLDLKTDKTTFDATIRTARMQHLRQRLFSGGGIRKVSATGVSWNQRIMFMGIGSSMAANGYHAVTMPVDGTVIPVYGSSVATTVTVAGGVIPMTGWRALYYDIDPGVTNSVDSRFKLMDYNAVTTQEVPDTWAFIVMRNVDTLAANYLWGDGRVQDYWKTLTLQNSWVAYGSSWPVPSWKFGNDGQVILRGLIKSGTVGLATPMFTFAIDLAPEGTATTGKIFQQGANTGPARVDVLGDGRVSVISATSPVGYLPLEGMSWFPNGA